MTGHDAAQGELQALADHWATTFHSPALAWGVVIDGRLALSGSCGALADDRQPSTCTVFRIASMTKSFTAATVLRLRDDGVLSLDEPLHELADARPTSDSPPITLRHLLSMQSGLTSDDPWADRHLDISPADLGALLAAGPTFASPPGTDFEYSNLGYGVIGRAVERITGRPVQEHVDELLVGPLGLERTTWHEPNHDEWARPHRIEDDQAVPDGPPVGDGALAPMGGLWSTIDDLAKIISWFDDAFPPRDGDDGGPLRRASRREQQQVQRATPVARTEAHGEGVEHVPERIDGGGYGFGMQVIHDHRFGHVVGHSGGLPGYGSNMRWLPGRRVGAVALANSTYAPMRLLTRRMLEVLDDLDVVPATVIEASPALRDAAERLLALLGAWTDDAADALFADNVGADESYARRALAAGELTSAHGRLHMQRVDASLIPNRRGEGDGTAVATAADGAEVSVWLALSPEPGGRVQDYTVETA